MKKKFFTSIAVTFVMAAALVAVAPTNAQAAKAINVKVGEKTTVKASKKVTWSIKDTSIATLNKKSGKKVKLTGVKEGSTILTTTDASGKKLDYAVNVKAAAPAAPAATNKLQEFANYVKSKGKIEYNSSVTVSTNWEKMKAVKWSWNPAGTIVLSDGKEYKVVWKPGVQNKEHDAHYVYTITADANNLYFRRTAKLEELDWRYINTTNYAPNDPTDKPDWAKKDPHYSNWTKEEFNENRYYIFGTTRDIESIIVTVPLNGGAAKAEFAHNFDYDFNKGVGVTFPNAFVGEWRGNYMIWKQGDKATGAMYSHWVYNFDKAKYLTNAAYSWDVDKDDHDYLSNSYFWEAIGKGNQFDWAKKIRAIGPSMSVFCSYALNGALNTFDNILKDNQTGFDLKSIGFDNFVNSAGHYFTNEEGQRLALYNAAWANIAYY